MIIRSVLLPFLGSSILATSTGLPVVSTVASTIVGAAISGRMPGLAAFITEVNAVAFEHLVELP